MQQLVAIESRERRLLVCQRVHVELGLAPTLLAFGFLVCAFSVAIYLSRLLPFFGFGRFRLVLVYDTVDFIIIIIFLFLIDVHGILCIFLSMPVNKDNQKLSQAQ